MEIILNQDYGGFELSDKAKALIIKRKGLPFYPYAKVSSEKFRRVSESEILSGTFRKLSCFDDIIWEVKDLGECVTEDTIYSEPSLFCDSNYHLNREDLRIDRDTIDVVKELGGEADSQFSSLGIVSIPDGSYYHIEDYDGMETCVYSASPISTI